MYNIGINQPKEKFDRTYLEILSQSNCNLHSLSVNDSTEEGLLDNLDGVILREDGINDMPTICGQIIKIKKNSNPFIWILSKEPKSTERVVYLQLGADGTFSESNEPEEVALIITNSLNRYMKFSNVPIKKIQKEESKDNELNFQLVPDNLSVRIGSDNKEISLTRMEFKLLNLLYANQSKGLTYEEIQEHLWEGNGEASRFRVANVVFHLREKLEAADLNPNIIRTVRSKGYMLNLKKV